MQFHKLRTWHFQHHNRFAQMLCVRNYNCYFCNYLAELHIFSISEWCCSCVQTRMAGWLLQPIYSIITYFSSHTRWSTSVLFCPLLPLSDGTGTTWRKRLDACVLLHSNLLLQKPATNGHSLRVPAHQSHHQEIEEHSESARNVQGLKY